MMEPLTAVRNHMLVIGVSTKIETNNILNAKEIDQLWDKFYSDNVYSKIPNKASDNIIALYYDYEADGDQIKSFRFLLGCEVTSFATIPPGMAAKEIPASTYAHFPVTGKFPEAIKDTWKTISKSILKRMFSGDLEVYSTENGRPNYKEVNIYISTE